MDVLIVLSYKIKEILRSSIRTSIKLSIHHAILTFINYYVDPRAIERET